MRKELKSYRTNVNDSVVTLRYLTLVVVFKCTDQLASSGKH